MIIVDGGSSDGTTQIILDNEERINYWVSEPDSGIYDAWNKALTKVTGEWVCFIGSDDYLRDSTVFEQLAEHLKSAAPSLDFLYSQVVLVNDQGQELIVTGTEWPKAFNSILRGMTVPHPAMMHRSALFKLSQFDDNYRIAGDYAFFLEHARVDNVAFADDVVAVCMRQGGISSQQGNFRVSLKECRRAQKKLGYRLPSPLWVLDFSLSEARNLVFRLLGEERAKRTVDFARSLLGLPNYWTKI